MSPKLLYFEVEKELLNFNEMASKGIIPLKLLGGKLAPKIVYTLFFKRSS